MIIFGWQDGACDVDESPTWAQDCPQGLQKGDLTKLKLRNIGFLAIDSYVRMSSNNSGSWAWSINDYAIKRMIVPPFLWMGCVRFSSIFFVLCGKSREVTDRGALVISNSWHVFPPGEAHASSTVHPDKSPVKCGASWAPESWIDTCPSLKPGIRSTGSGAVKLIAEALNCDW